MLILIADQPGTNSYLRSLIESYKSAGLTVLCGLHNFFYSNIKPDLLHIQWPEKLYNWYPFSTLNDEEKYIKIREKLNWYKENNVYIIHTIHNIKPHVAEKFDFEEKIFRLIISHSDLLVHHCSKSAYILNHTYQESKGKSNIVCPHGDYLLDYRNINKTEARIKLGIPKDKFVILNFGNQLKYKNEHFIESVYSALTFKEKYLFTAGNNRSGGFSKGTQAINYIKRNLRMKLPFSSKKYYYKVVSPDDLPFFINSADIFFLAHSGNNLNSGILPLVATYSKPAVFPDIGCFREQMSSWIFETYPQGNKTGAVAAINNLYSKIKNHQISLDNSRWLELNSWEKHVKIILKAVNEKSGVTNVL